MKKFADFLKQEEIEEASSPHFGEPPAILVLKRRYIRTFPGGQKLAMYWSDNIGRFIAVPFDKNTTVTEALEVPSFNNELEQKDAEREEQKQTEQPKNAAYRNDIMFAAREAVQTKTDIGIKFVNGGTMTIDQTTANLLMNVYDQLNKKNKWKFNLLIKQSPKNYLSLVKFAIAHQ